MTIPRPAADEHAPYYLRYIALVPDGDLIAELGRQGRATAAMLRRVPADRAHFRYQPGKWSVLEVIGHVIDAERVFAYRALCFSRADATPLPSFDENAWVPGSEADQRPLEGLVAEFEAVRAATAALFAGMNPRTTGAPRHGQRPADVGASGRVRHRGPRTASRGVAARALRGVTNRPGAPIRMSSC